MRSNAIEKSSLPPALGQLLIIGFEGTKLSPRLNSLLTRIQPAGVILFARNIKTPEQTWRLLRDCQQCVSTPLFTCVDLEGGTVDRFRNVLGPTPSAADVFAARKRELFRRHGRLIGDNCRALGFNVDFAPALDLGFEASRPVMATRTVSADPRQTISYARPFLRGLADARILGCGKHFPGLGEGKLDSHHDLPVIDKSLKKLWAEDLLPYRTLRRQLPMVMVSHAAYPQVTRDRNPASLSKTWITDILRKQIGYRNLIVSDDLEMGGVLSAAPVGEAAVAHIRAGGDLCLVCHREDYVYQAFDALTGTAQDNPKFARRAAESVKRVQASKKQSAKMLRINKSPSSVVVARLSRRLWEFGEQVRLEVVTRENQKKRSRA
ncbi:MAG TPA: beta-N-acetylhexosaminidase [Candidatus Sulfotelmatobacter sp.]